MRSCGPPTAIKIVAISFGYPSELEGKTLLLTALHSWIKGHGEVRLVLTQKFHL